MALESRLLNLAATAHKLVNLGMIHGLSASVSLRWEDACYLSPAGAWMDRLSAADFISLKIAGGNTWQLQRASPSYALHLACYRARPDAATVLCLQPPHCVALGCAGLTIRAMTPDFYFELGAEIPLLPYLALATQALADGVGQVIATHQAVLLQNQGLVLVAPSTDEAFARSLLVEDAARIVLLAHAATGACATLTEAQIEELEPLRGQR